MPDQPHRSTVAHRTATDDATDDRGGEPPVEIDTDRAHHARVYNYWLGSKDHFAADRAAGDAVIAALPTTPRMVRANREFLGRAVTHLVTGLGVRQFLDIGSGLPTAANVHQVAQAADPTARVVYVDHDPIVAAHSRALMPSAPQGRTAFVAADARDPAAILDDPTVIATLDRHEPIALMLISMLLYFTDDQAHHIITTLMQALPSGSYLTISHPTADFAPDAAAQAVAAARNAGLIYHLRTRDQVIALFAGLDLVEPGVVPMLTWRPPPVAIDPDSVFYHVGMARKL